MNTFQFLLIVFIGLLFKFGEQTIVPESPRGIKNQGNTCYLNAWLQALLSVDGFSRALYKIPSDSGNTAENKIVVALQRFFYNAQFTKNDLNTEDLTKLMNKYKFFDSSSTSQQDSNEFALRLFDRIEEESADTSLTELFSGSFVSLLKTDFFGKFIPNENYDKFVEIPLNLTKVDSLKEALDNYFEDEFLPECKTNGAKGCFKKSMLHELPSIMIFHLMRFEYGKSNEKIDKEIKFPEWIDLQSYLNETNGEAEIYTLHAVVVHQGKTANSGHYYTYAKRQEQWYKLNDSSVDKVKQEEAMNNNFDGKKKDHSAYMLLYIRDRDREKILEQITINDVPDNIKSPVNIKNVPANSNKVNGSGNLGSRTSPPSPEPKIDTSIKENDKEKIVAPATSVTTSF